MIASRLPFAIGSVQDAGLIFLSTMSSTVVQSCSAGDGSGGLKPGLTREDVLITTVFTLAGSTTLLGIALMLTGHFKLTNLVQYLPMPVVGGYLAYIGQFCLEAAVGLMSTKSVAVDCVPLWESISNDECGWTKVWSGHDPTFIAVGVALGLLLMQLQHRIEHVAVFPAAMAAIVGGFYLILVVRHGGDLGAGVGEAREWGWLKAPQPVSGHGGGGDGGDDHSGSGFEPAPAPGGDSTADLSGIISLLSGWRSVFNERILISY